jgi:hypothetical protein
VPRPKAGAWSLGRRDLVLERTREIGALRATGVTKLVMWSIVVTEGLLVGLLSGGVGGLHEAVDLAKRWSWSSRSWPRPATPRTSACVRRWHMSECLRVLVLHREWIVGSRFA